MMNRTIRRGSRREEGRDRQEEIGKREANVAGRLRKLRTREELDMAWH